MKKMKLLGLLLTLFIFCYHADAMQKGNALSRARSESSMALSTLQSAGLRDPEAVRNFKERIRKLISDLDTAQKTGDQSGRIDMQIGAQEDLLLLVDLLIQYDQHPTNVVAEKLRSLAKSDSTITGFVKHIMDAQVETWFRFS